MTYLLLLVAAAIWGVIVWKIFFYKPTPDRPAQQQAHAMTDNAGADTLYLNYPDPFRINPTKQPPPSQLKPLPVKQELKPIMPAKKPEVKYNGRIKKNNTYSCLVEIEKKPFLMQQGDSEAGYTIVKITQDSLHISFEGGLFTVALTE